MLGILELFIVVAIPIFFVIGLPLILTYMMLRRVLGNKKDTASATGTADEMRMIQEMHHGFLRMEERINALETILLERDKFNSSSDNSPLNR